MELTKKDALILYHYCTSITDALRPVLNTDDQSKINNEYWSDTLFRFNNVITNILNYESPIFQKLYSDITHALLTQQLLNENAIVEIADIISKQVWDKLQVNDNE